MPHFVRIVTQQQIIYAPSRWPDICAQHLYVNFILIEHKLQPQ